MQHIVCHLELKKHRDFSTSEQFKHRPKKKKYKCQTINSTPYWNREGKINKTHIYLRRSHESHFLSFPHSHTQKRWSKIRLPLVELEELKLHRLLILVFRFRRRKKKMKMNRTPHFGRRVLPWRIAALSSLLVHKIPPRSMFARSQKPSVVSQDTVFLWASSYKSPSIKPNFFSFQSDSLCTTILTLYTSLLASNSRKYTQML